MYKRTAQGWLKHLDFIVLDILCLQAAFFLAYWIRQRSGIPYQNETYTAIGILITVFDVLVAVMTDSMHNVIKRGYYKEFIKSLMHCGLVTLLTILWMFMLKNSDEYSRTVVFITFFFHLGIGYAVRLLWKKHLLRHGTAESGKQAMLAVLDSDTAEKMVERLTNSMLDGYHLAGIVLSDDSTSANGESSSDAMGQRAIMGIPVVCSFDEAAQYICREWIDGVFISSKGTTPRMREFMQHCAEMGVTIHYHVPNIGQDSNKQFVEKIGGSTVLTSSVNYATHGQLIVKRTVDIVGGLLGSLAALLVIAIVGPIIKKASPGPILYRSERIGQNGKRFRMFKIRSMYMDADARKALLMAQNRVKDGLMFKLDFDPRIIGNKELPDGTRKTGIGEFIRKTSLDEFPQFFNVLRGDMSLVGTRPPTPDEWEKYKFHHRARLATKPGITGMWQVSGRSEITDFEEVVKLDTEYIRNWSIGMDLKILLKTVVNVIARKGAM